MKQPFTLPVADMLGPFILRPDSNLNQFSKP
jgi:hypothetical protein